MKKYLIHSIKHSEYIGIITILDNEIHLRTYLAEVHFSPTFKGKKVIVDLALMTGLNQYRFVSFDIDDNGNLLLNSNCYIPSSKDIENLANRFLKQNRVFVINSMLTKTQKQKILN